MSHSHHPHSHSHSHDGPPPDKQELLQKEGQFWDLQEEQIEELYARPHDWRFFPKIADLVMKPRHDTLRRLFRQHKSEWRTLLDVGCGNGWFCHWAAQQGVKSFGIDLASKKIDAAKRLAADKGVSGSCEFWAGDVLEWRPEQKVDLLTSHGSLHHFPEFDAAMQHMVEHFLKPDGWLLLVEPKYEGMAPEVREHLLDKAKNSWLRKHFDFEFYAEVTGRQSLAGSAADEQAKAEATEVDIRDESPAGKEFFGEHVDLDAYFANNFDVVEKEYYQYYAGHATNAFYTFMKSKWVRRAWRLMLPSVVRRDTKRLLDLKYQQYAEDGLWLMRPKGVRGSATP
ncbi:MAG: class I SAM-dependent methyltransferase [Planctomycetota bacterium]